MTLAIYRVIEASGNVALAHWFWEHRHDFALTITLSPFSRGRAEPRGDGRGRDR